MPDILRCMATRKKAAKKPAKRVATKKRVAKKVARRPAAKVAAKAAPKPALKVVPELAKRADFGKPIGPFIAKLKPPIKEIVERLRAAINEAAPRAVEELKWGMPVWSDHGLLCYTAIAKDYVRFGFYQAGIIEGDAQGLEIEGTSKMAHVKLRGVGDLRPALFRQWVTRAASLHD